MGDSSNGSTLSFASSGQAKVRSINVNTGGGELNMTTLASSGVTTDVGFDEIEVTAELLGISPILRGDTGAIVIAWASGDSEILDSSFICTDRGTSGDVDTELTTSLTFKPTTPASI